MMLRFRLSILVALLWASAAWTSEGARAALIDVSFTVFCSPCNFAGTIPVGLSNLSVFSGSLTIDNEAGNSPASITRLDYITGSKAWTLAEINSVSAIYGPDGLLQNFLIDFNARSTRTTSLILSDGLWSIVSSGLGYVGCNDCLTYSQQLAAVPEPMSLALFGIGLLGLGAVRRRAFLEWGPAD